MEKSGLSTANLDIVYFVKEGVRNDELRYSLRSVCENMAYKRIWIYGGCPNDIIPDFRARIVQEGETKWDRVRNMFKMVCENKEITDDFILFNDDFFVMKPTSKLIPLWRCSLEEHVELSKAAGFRKRNPYADILEACRKILEEGGFTQHSYELHTPFIYNKARLLKILEEYPDAHCTRTLYGNIYNIGGQQSDDVKAFSETPNFDYRESQFISTDDSIVNINNSVWRYIKGRFPKRCKYERGLFF